jgi:hypothetical protein
MKNKEILLKSSKEVNIKINAENIKYHLFAVYLVLLIVGNYDLQRQVVLQRHDAHFKLN